MRAKRVRFVTLMLVVCLARAATRPVAGAAEPAARRRTESPTAGSPAQTLAQSQGSVKISLDDAIQMALQHNHSLLAARTTIQQNEAEEITANLRPNPVLLGDALFLPIFQPDQFNYDYVDANAQFDLGISYLFERGKKRQHRLQAARDATAVTRSQVADNERSLTFNVAQQFIASNWPNRLSSWRKTI